MSQKSNESRRGARVLGRYSTVYMTMEASRFTSSPAAHHFGGTRSPFGVPAR